MTEMKTEKGIKLICIAMLAMLILSAVNIILIFAVIPGLMASVSIRSVDSFYRATGTLFVINSLLCLAILGLLVVKIFGIAMVYLGRAEFGSEHDRKASIGGILIIVGFVIGQISTTSGLGAILFALGMVFLIMTIAREEHRRLLWIGFGFTVALSLLSQFLVLYQMFIFRYFISLTYLIIIQVGSLIGSALTLLAYHGTYRGIKEGAIAPVTGPWEQHAPPIQKGKAVPEKTVEVTREDECGDLAVYLSNTLGISKRHASALQEAGYGSIHSLRSLTAKDLISIRGVNPTVARKIVGRLREMKGDEMVAHFSNTFGIDMEAARAVYEAGYRTMQDLEFATIDELILMDGINPTVARKVVRKIEMESGLVAY